MARSAAQEQARVHDGGVRELTHDLGLAQKLLLLWSGAERVNERLDGHGPADDLVARFVHATGGAETQGAKDLVTVFLHG